MGKYKIFYVAQETANLAKAAELCKCYQELEADLENGTDEEAAEAIRKDASRYNGAEPYMANLRIIDIVPMMLKDDAMTKTFFKAPHWFPARTVLCNAMRDMYQLAEIIRDGDDHSFAKCNDGFWRCIVGEDPFERGANQFGPAFDTREDAEQAVSLIRSAYGCQEV